MAPGSYRFERFLLDPGNRQLRRDGAAVELNGRYLDALALLVREQGQLVSKDRFLKEVWRGVPVTDEAITQCIRTLRRQLGDTASAPCFIETVPKYGYRFIAPVEWIDHEAGSPAATEAGALQEEPQATSWRQRALLGGAGSLGGGFAGCIGGLLYGFAVASGPQAGTGGASVLLVLFCITALIGLIGGAGVGVGVATECFARGRPGPWSTVGGALGGLVVGAIGKLLGLDAINLLFGRSPGDITGAVEGAALGGAVGMAAWLGSRGSGSLSLRRSIAAAALSGGLAGILIPLLGGRLLGGSLHLLIQSFPDSRLRLDPVGALFGESGFGTISQLATGGLEGTLFGGCTIGAMELVRRGLSRTDGRPLLG